MTTVRCSPKPLIQVNNLFESGIVRISKAEKFAHLDAEEAHNIAYAGIQNLLHSLIKHDGFFTKSSSHHLEGIDYARSRYFFEIGGKTIYLCDEARKRRNRSCYKKTGTITLEMTQQTINTAKELRIAIRGIISKNMNS